MARAARAAPPYFASCAVFSTLPRTKRPSWSDQRLSCSRFASGHTEELGDDDGRQRVGEVGDEIHPSLRPERIQELVHYRPHVRFEPGNVPREERVLHRPPELPVAGADH